MMCSMTTCVACFFLLFVYTWRNYWQVPIFIWLFIISVPVISILGKKFNKKCCDIGCRFYCFWGNSRIGPCLNCICDSFKEMCDCVDRRPVPESNGTYHTVIPTSAQPHCTLSWRLCRFVWTVGFVVSAYTSLVIMMPIGNSILNLERPPLIADAPRCLTSDMSRKSSKFFFRSINSEIDAKTLTAVRLTRPLMDVPADTKLRFRTIMRSVASFLPKSNSTTPAFKQGIDVDIGSGMQTGDADYWPSYRDPSVLSSPLVRWSSEIPRLAVPRFFGSPLCTDCSDSETLSELLTNSIAVPPDSRSSTFAKVWGRPTIWIEPLFYLLRRIWPLNALPDHFNGTAAVALLSDAPLGLPSCPSIRKEHRAPVRFWAVCSDAESLGCPCSGPDVLPISRPEQCVDPYSAAKPGSWGRHSHYCGWKLPKGLPQQSSISLALRMAKINNNISDRSPDVLLCMRNPHRVQASRIIEMRLGVAAGACAMFLMSWVAVRSAWYYIFQVDPSVRHGSFDFPYPFPV
eukprot:Lankesteria_metandrocarpae@DN5992_c0_g1_i1.p1